MPLRATALPFIILLLCYCSTGRAQDSTAYAKLYSLPDKMFGRISQQTLRLEQKLERQTQRYLERLAKQENKMRNKLWKKDSAAAKALFGDPSAKYAELQNQLTGSPKAYNGHLDSLQTALNFLQSRQGNPGVETKHLCEQRDGYERVF
jgi:hypothetical protein